MWIKIRTLKKSFRYAWRGFRYTYQHEQNFRIQTVVSLLVVIAALLFRIRGWQAVALLAMIVFVLVLEILNTVVERFIDILQPRLQHYSEIIKDMMAAVVLLAAIGALLVGIIIFYPYISSFVSENMV